jgi:hypothetical protein
MRIPFFKVNLTRILQLNWCFMFRLGLMDQFDYLANSEVMEEFMVIVSSFSALCLNLGVDH